MKFRDEQPIYLQIANYVCEKILSAQWDQNARIPSVRDLAIELEVNPNTVMRTCEFLQQKNIIYNQRGLGLFVSADGVKQATAYLRTEFLEKEVPAFIRSMTLLEIDMDELDTIIRKYKKVKK